nr:brain my038 protein [Homo sapiens]
MSCVHYKFSSKLNYDTVTFDGLHISLCDLKKQIMGREKLKAADCDLQITNAQTKEGKGRLVLRYLVAGERY